MDTASIKKDFEILKRKINNKPLVYLDNAATSQKPKEVIEAILSYYDKSNANVHRGIHLLSEEATGLYENARKKVSDFLGAECPKEVIFTSGTTNSLNMAAAMIGEKFLKKNDVILTTDIEHNSNFIPWQQISIKKEAELNIIEVYGKDNTDIIRAFKQKLTNRVKIVALTHVSNVTAVIMPIREIAKLAHNIGAIVVVDAAQSAPHMPVNVKTLGCDMLAFSGHKMMAGTGIGVLWVKNSLLEKLEPVIFGGGMIDDVELDHSVWAESPYKFEAGTPNIEGAISLGAAIDYLSRLGMGNILKHEIELTGYLLTRLRKIDGINILGPVDPNNRCGIVAFTIDGIHPHDLAAICNGEGVAIRSGHHCATILHKKLNIEASSRVSFYVYNDTSDIDMFMGALHKAIKILK